MKVTVKIPDELVSGAQERGVSLEAYVETILAQQVPVRAPGTRRRWTQDEIRSWLDSLAQFSSQIPPLPEIISREWIYQDHD